MSIKLKYLCLAHRKHADQAHPWMTAGRKKLTHPLPEADRNQEMFDFTPSPFSIKKAWILTQARWVLWGTSPPSSQFAGFPNKVTIPCSSNLSLDLLACCVASSTSLDSVTHWQNTYYYNPPFTDKGLRLWNNWPKLRVIKSQSQDLNSVCLVSTSVLQSDPRQYKMLLVVVSPMATVTTQAVHNCNIDKEKA